MQPNTTSLLKGQDMQLMKSLMSLHELAPQKKHVICCVCVSLLTYAVSHSCNLDLLCLQLTA